MTRTAVILSVIAASVAGGCADQATIEGRSCPCSDGYTCCATNICVPEGTACSVVEPTTLDRTSLPCSYDVDNDLDGSIDVHFVSYYDGNGNDVRDDGDIGLDGTINDVITESYDASHQVTQIHEELDGTVYADVVITYDELERQILQVSDNGDGTSATLTFAYDGMTATEDIDYSTDGSVDYHEVVTQNAAGKPTSSTGTVNGSSFTRMWLYSASGGLLQRTRYAGDGSVARTDTYTRDAQGRLLDWVYADAGGVTRVEVANTYADDDRFDTQTITGADYNPPQKYTFHYSCE